MMFITRYLSVFEIGDELLLLVNTLSGAVDVIERTAIERLDAFLSGKTDVVDEALLSTMLDRGYLFIDQDEESRFLEKISAAAHESAGHEPASFVISPTGNCNCSCTYCYAKELFTEGALLSHEMVDRIFDAIELFELMIPSPKTKIVLSGGEPLLPETYDVVHYIANKAVEKKITVSALTNGTKLGPFIPLFRDLGDRFDELTITLDGPKKLHDARRPTREGLGTFDATVEAIELALNAGLKVHLRTNLDSENILSLEELAEFIIRRGWHGFVHFHCSLGAVTERCSTAKRPNILGEGALLDIFLQLLDRSPSLRIFDLAFFKTRSPLQAIARPELPGGEYAPRFDYCQATKLRSFSFAPDGLIYPCGESQGKPEFALGSYYPSYTLDREKVRSWADRTIGTLTQCRECTLSTLCGGGCPLEAIAVNRSIDQPVCPGISGVLEAEAKAASKRILALLKAGAVP